jgi:hypothetical protein
MARDRSPLKAFAGRVYSCHMRTIFIAALLVLLPVSFAHGASDYYLKIDGVEGETTKAVQLETQSGVVGQPFVLDGSKSQDDGTVSRLLWKQVSGPTVRLASTTAAKLSVTPTQAGTYVFELTVTDAAGKSSVAQKTEVVVTAPPAPTSATVAAPVTKPQEASADVLIKIPPVDGETSKGKVEMEWKVEEGEKAAVPGVEPDEIDVQNDPEPITPDFSILLGGGDSEQAQQARTQIADVLLKGAAEEGAPVEQVSLNFEKIKTKTRQQVKLFGFIPVAMSATVEIDAQGSVSVRFPWWAFLAGGKNEEQLGQQTSATLLSVLKKNQALVDGLLMIRY